MTLNQVLDALKSCGLEYSLAEEEYASETEYVKALLQSICDSAEEKNDRFNQANILKLIYCHPDITKQDLQYTHECLVSSHKAPKSWFGPKKIVCKNYWELHIITKEKELFNVVNHYGIGFIDGKYFVEWQEWNPPGDKPHTWFGSIPYGNYYDAFTTLKSIAEYDVSFEY